MVRDGRRGVAALNATIDVDNMIQSVADQIASETASSPKDRPAFNKLDFIRYLRSADGLPPDLLGRIVYLVVHLTDWFDTPTSLGVPKELHELWPPPVDRRLLIEDKDYSRLAGAYSEALRIDRSVFTEIWMARCGLMIREMKRDRQAAYSSVFWAARLLEAIDPRTYNAYCRWVDEFHRPFTRIIPMLYQTDRAYEVWACCRPFEGALSSDPLLNCVFHSEVLKGRNQLRPPAEKKGPDYLLENRFLAYAKDRLQPFIHPDSPTIVEALSGVKLANQRCLQTVGLGISGGVVFDGTISPRGVYAYVAPLAQAILDREDYLFTPQVIQDRCLGHADDPEVLAHEKDLMRQVGSALFGE